MHMPLHPQGHCDGCPYCNRKLLPTDEVDGSEYQGIYVTLRVYNETRSWDIPCCILQKPLSGNFHQKVGCAPLMEAMRSFICAQTSGNVGCLSVSVRVSP